MLARKGQESNSENNGAVCPESMIESANRRSNVQAPVERQSGKNLVCESTTQSANRRGFIKKAALITAAAAVGSSLLGHAIIPESSAQSYANSSKRPKSPRVLCAPISGSSPAGAGVTGSTCSGKGVYGIASTTGKGVYGCSICGDAVYGCSFGTGVHGISTFCSCSGVGGSGPGVQGCSIDGPGVYGVSSSGLGLSAQTNGFLIGKFKNAGAFSDKTALIQFETGDTTVVDWNVGVAGTGNGLSIADGNFYIEQLGHGARMAIDKCGRVGIGTASPSSSLCVAGNVGIHGGVKINGCCTVVRITTSVGPYAVGNALCVTGCLGEGPYNGEGCLVLGRFKYLQTTCPGSHGTCTSAKIQIENGACYCGLSPTAWNIGVTSCGIGAPACGKLFFQQLVGGASQGVKMVLQGNNLGVGTTSPQAIIHSVSPPGTKSLFAESNGALVSEFKNTSTAGDRSALIAFETGDTTPVDWNTGVAGACNALKVPDGSFYVQHANPSTNSPSIVVNTSGQVGIGTTNPTVKLDVIGYGSVSSGLGVGTGFPQTTLQVNGGVSFRVAIKTSSYTMTTSDYGILANASTAALTITLPPASKAGMVVHIKKIDNSSHAVTVSRAGTDTIEGAITKTLTAQYQSLTLLAGGNGVWYIQSNAT
jgi:hypothetical protein